MNTSEPSIPQAVDLRFKQLRMLVHAIAISLLILTGTVFVFVYREVVLTRRQTAELARLVVQYERSDTKDFIARIDQRLGDFAKLYPDFAPIYIRYFGTNQAAQPKVQPAETNR